MWRRNLALQIVVGRTRMVYFTLRVRAMDESKIGWSRSRNWRRQKKARLKLLAPPGKSWESQA
jgi:hypothetical protein